MENGGSGNVIPSLQYLPVKKVGTALNIITETTNKMAMTQLRSANKILTAGQDLIKNKDAELKLIDGIAGKVSAFY